MVQIIVLDKSDEAHHKKCIKCKGSKLHSQFVQCCYESCNNYCHLKCLPENLRTDVVDWPEYFCNDSCRVNRDQKRASSFTMLKAEVEKLKYEQSQNVKTNVETLQTMDLMKNTITQLQEQNRLLVAQNQSLSLLSSTRAPTTIDMNIFNPSIDENMLNFSSLQDKLRKTAEEINVSLGAAATGPSTSGESDDPFHGKTFQAKGEATVEHAKTSYLLSLREIRRNLGDLPEFDGKGSAWLKFKTRFNKIKDVGDYKNCEMVEKLEKALKGPALKYVQAWIDSPNPCATKIMTDLEERFFNADTVMQEGLNSVISFGKIKTWNRESLEDYARVVDTYIHLCTTVGHSINLNGRLPGEIEDKLPDDLLREWLKHKHTPIANGSWFEFSLFLKNSVKHLKLRLVDQQKSKDSKESKI